MSDSDTPPEPTFDRMSLRRWVEGLDRGTRERGAALTGSAHVISSGSDVIVGLVRDDAPQPWRVTLRHHERAGHWVAACDCPVGVSCKHAVALALAAAGTEDSATPENIAEDNDAEGDFVQKACEALGRNLTRKETLALSGIAEACAPKRHGRPVSACIEATLHAIIGNDYATLNRLPAELEADAKEPNLLLAAIAAALSAEGKPLPAWIPALIERSGAAETLDARVQARALEDWKRTLGGFSAAPAEAGPKEAASELRLRRTGPWKFQWEFRRGPNAEWSHLTPKDREEILRPTFDLETLLTRRCARIAEHFRTFAAAAGNAIAFDARDLPAGKAFGELLLRPAMITGAVEEDGAPLRRSDTKLVWTFIPSPGRPGHARPSLTDADGAPAPGPIRPIGAGLYLSEEAVHAGPPPLGEFDGRGTAPEIPVAVFEDPAVRSALKAAGARIPGNFEIVRVPVTPLLRVTLDPYGMAGDLSLATAELSGMDRAGRIRVVLTEGNWTGIPVHGEPEERVADTTKLEPARRHFFTGPRLAGVAGEAVIGENSVEDYADWLSGFPAGTRFELPQEIEALMRPPEIATLAANLAEAKESTDWFDLKLVLRPEDAEITASEMKLLLAHSGKWVKLPDKGWRRMEAGLTDATREALTALGLDPEKVALGDNHRYHAAQLSGSRVASLFDAAASADLRRRADRLESLEPPELPPGLQASLRPYQTEGYRFLAHLSSNGLGGILADDMGLGKTLQTITWLLWLRATRPGETDTKRKRARILVVAPKSVVGNWIAETRKFAPELVTAIHGEDTVKAIEKADLVVTNYARLRRGTADFLSTEWTAVVLDEGQHIKTPTSQVAETARALKTRHRLILSGTPVENRLTDLWSLFSFAMPGLLGTLASFRRQYDEKKDDTAASRLAARIRPFLLRRTKSQVATDLPERIEEDLVIDLEPLQRRLYDAEMKKVRAMLLDAKTAKDFDRERFNILASLLRLRQICCDPRLVSEKAGEKDSAKIDALMELLEPLVAEGHKVLVFSQFTGMLSLISKRLKSEGIAHLTLTGATENRTELVERFQKEDTEKVFLLSLKAAGTGLNLTAASYAVLYDPWWNPAAEAQAIDRTHRIGQKNRVIAYRFIARNSVEEKIRALQREKAALAGEILREESLSKVLDLDTLRNILAD